MSKLFLLVKINLLNSFKSLSNGKSKFIIPSLLFFYLGFCYYEIGTSLLPSFIELNKPYYFILLGFIIINSMVIYFNLFKTKSILFDFKDYDLLSSLPIKKNTILASKLISLYFWNLIFTLIIGIPNFINFINMIDVSINFYIIYLISLLFIPLIPLVVSCIFGIILAWLISFFRNKKVGNYIVTICILLISFFLVFKSDSIDNSKLALDSINFLDKFSIKYPLINIYNDLIMECSYLKLLLFIIISAIIFSLVVYIIALFYDYIRSKLLKTYNKSDYKIKKYHTNPKFFALYNKEIKKLFSIPSYVINCLFGCFTSIIMVILLVVLKDNYVEELFNYPGLINYLKDYGPEILSLLVLISSTTHCSISLEGKNLWLIKSLPIDTNKVFLSKILTNLSILIPTIIIDGIVLSIYFKLGFLEVLSLFILPITCSIFISIFGLLINLLFPILDYGNEIKVIKQSSSSFITITSGLIIGLLIFSYIFKYGNTFSVIMRIVELLVLITILLSLILFNYGKRLYRKL